MKRLLIILILLGLAAGLFVVSVNLWVTSYAADRTFETIDSVPAEGRVAIVLGARVEDDGTPSNTLNDRTVTAAELYNAGKVSKLIMSGGKNEPEVMKKLAMSLGVAESDIYLDDQGLRTFDSCFQAKQVFNVNRAIIVTQDYHLARSIYLCRSLGVDAVGVNSKRRDYLGERWLWVREYMSRVLAWYDINFEPLPPEPAAKQPIT